MWFYAKDGRETGPVSDAELDALTARGVIDAATLVWREGMAVWHPLSSIREATAIPKAGQEACSQCGTFYSPDDLVAVSGLKVCGACKPMVVQRIKEGLPLTNRVKAWADNKLVVTEAETELPRRCFRCNSSDVQTTVKAKMERSFTINRSFSIQVHFCLACGKKKRMKSWMAGATFVLGFGGILMALAGAIPSAIATLGLISVLATSLSLSTFDRPARLQKSKGTTLWVSGASRPFLDSLPKWPN